MKKELAVLVYQGERGKSEHLNSTNETGGKGTGHNL